MSKSKSTTSEETTSSFPRCGLSKLDDRRKWYGWLRTVKSVEEGLLKPQMLSYWEGSLSDSQQRKLKAHVLNNLGGPGEWKKFTSYLQAQRRQTKLRVNLSKGRTDKNFILAVNEKLSDVSEQVVMIEEGVVHQVLILRASGMPADIVASQIGISEESVNRLASPVAMAAFRDSDIEVIAEGSLWKKLWLIAAAAPYTEEFKTNPKLVLDYLKFLKEHYHSGTEADRAKKAKKVSDFDAYRKEIVTRHAELSKKIVDKTKNLSSGNEGEGE